MMSHKSKDDDHRIRVWCCSAHPDFSNWSVSTQLAERASPWHLALHADRCSEDRD